MTVMNWTLASRERRHINDGTRMGHSGRRRKLRYLNKGVAQKFHELFPASDLFLLPTARHFVQMDEPEEVAHLILSTRTM